MDRQRLEYNAILEQVTREASQQAERDLRARAQAEVVRNFPGNILNRLDIQARLGSRVAPIEELTHALPSRHGLESSVLRQQLPIRSQPLMQSYPEHDLGFSSRLMNRLDDVRLHHIRSSLLRNHYPVQHGSFADDFNPEENIQVQIDHPVRPLMDLTAETQQRMISETQEEREMLSQSGSLFRKANRSLLRAPVSHKNQASPSSSRFLSNLRGNASTRSPSNTSIPSANTRSFTSGGADPNRKKPSVQARDKLAHPAITLVKVNDKPGPVSTKTSAANAATRISASGGTVAKTSTASPASKAIVGGKVEKANELKQKTQAASPREKKTPSEKKMPSLFGPPPSAPSPVRSNQKGNTHKSTPKTSNGDGALGIVESLSPKPLMDLTPSLAGLPFSNTSFSESVVQPVSTVKTMEKKSSDLQLGPPDAPSEATGKPVPLLDIKPVPLFDIKAVSHDVKNTAQPLSIKKKRLSSSESSSVDVSKCLEAKSKCATREEENKEDSMDTLSSKLVAKEKSKEQENSKEQEKSKEQEQIKEQKETERSSMSSHAEEFMELEEPHDVTKPLWYTNADSLSVGTSSALTGDIEENCSANEVEEGEIIGESQDDMEIVEKPETNYYKVGDLVLMTPEITSTTESSGSILAKFYAQPKEFVHFLPFPAEASEENVKSIEKCWQQLLILRSFTRKQKRTHAQKIMSRIKSHFAQVKTKPTNGAVQFCFKLWSHIATHLGEYLSQRLQRIVRGLMHRSMIDFILILLHKKKKPRSLKNISIKAQINLLYIFNMQGFTNATNNYMVKWLQDELEKVSSRTSLTSGTIMLDVNLSIANAHLNSLVLDDQLMEKKFCLVEYLKSKSFNDPKEEEQCVRVCSILQCQDYIPNAEWKCDGGKSNQTSDLSATTNVLIIDATSSNSEPSSASRGADTEAHEVHDEARSKTGLEKITSEPEMIVCDSDAEMKIDETRSEKNVDDLEQSDAVSTDNKIIDMDIEPIVSEAVILIAGGSNQIDKNDNTGSTQAVDSTKENMSVTIPEIEITSPEKITKAFSHDECKKKEGHSRKLHSSANSAGKWRSYTVDGSSSSGGGRIARKRKQDIGHRNRRHFDRHRAGSNSLARSRLTNRSSSGERSEHSDRNKSVDSDSDSEELEMMMLRKKALLSMLKGSMAKNSGSNSDSKETQIDEKDELPLVQKDSGSATDKLAVEQISDAESSASPVAHSIGDSGVVLVSLGTDNVVGFPSQYSTSGTLSEAEKPKEIKDDSQLLLERQKITVDEKTENLLANTATSVLKQSEETSKPSSPAYYKVSTGSNEQKQAKKGKQSFVICVTSEDSDSDATNTDVTTAPHSTVTSGTSSPMPVQQDSSSLSTRRGLEELIQHYKKRAKEKEVGPQRNNNQGLLKSPDAIKIMPQLKQDEYRSLKEQLAQLEKKKNEKKKANKRKATIPPQHQVKKLKVDSANKDEIDNQKQQSEVLMQTKREIEYQTSIAICEVQLEELKVTIDRGYSDVMRLNKQLSDCVLEIEEHTIKLQLLNKQLKIAKDSLEAAQAKQQEIKSKVKLAQNNLLKDKNALTVVEGELANFRSLLSQQSQQKPMLQKNNQTIGSVVDSSLIKTKSNVLDLTNAEKFTVNSNISQQTSDTSDNAKDSSLDIVNNPNLDNAATTSAGTENITSGCTNSSLSLKKKSISKDDKIKPGEKIDSVAKKLSKEVQERDTHATSRAALTVEKVTSHSENRSTRKSLDAVVTQLHIVKKQEFDKQFHVDLGPAKQVRDIPKLNNVVKMLVAKQSQSGRLSSDYPVDLQTLAKASKASAVVDSSSFPCMVSSTVPDNLDGSKIGMEANSTIRGVSRAQRKWIKKDPVAEKRQDVGNPMTVIPQQAVQVKLTSEPKSINKVGAPKTQRKSTKKDSIVVAEITEKRQDVNGSVSVTPQQAAQVRSTSKDDTITDSGVARSKEQTGSPVTTVMLTARIQCTLGKVSKFITEKFAITPKDLEGLLEKNPLKEISNDATCGNLTEYYIENSQVNVQQNIAIPDAVLVQLLQPAQLQEPSTISSSAASSFYSYRSPLSCFKSYRLHPYYRTRAKLAVSSSTYSNKINPNKVMCRFNMTGKCSDKNCTWQHWNETQMDSNELFSDLVSYAPDLAMVTNSDDSTTAQNKIRARTTNMVSSLGGKMTTDEIGVYLVDQVVNNADNKTFNARIEGKLPLKSTSGIESSSSIQRPKSFISNYKAVFDSTYTKLGTLGQIPAKISTQQPDRYFVLSTQGSHEVDSSCDPKAVVLSVRESLLQNHDEDVEKVHKSATILLEAAIRTKPQEETLWIELIKIHAISYVKLPIDPINLNLFQSVCQRAVQATDSYTVLQECISLLPTYDVKRAWYIKGYDAVKLKTNKGEKSFQCLELFFGSVVLDYMTGYTVEAIEKMKFSLRLKESQSHYAFKDLLDHLTSDDLLLFWMVYIHYCHSHAFPDCVIKITGSRCKILEKKTFVMQWKEGERLTALYNNFIQLFKVALKHCKSVYSEHHPDHTSAAYALQFQNLFENLILLEYKCGNLEAAKISIRKVLSVHPSHLGMWLFLADVVVNCGYTDGYKEVYVEAENILRGNMEFYHIISKKIYQQGDRNEAMRWLTSCVYSKYTGKCLNATEYDVILHYRKLLKQPVPYQFQTSAIAAENTVDDTSHLWLCYCFYLELVGAPKAVSEYWPTAEDAYEAAVHSVHSPAGVKLVWKEYLAFLRCSVTSKDAGLTNWKQFLDGINRAFQVVDPEDHKFQIEVIDMCIAALPAGHDDKALGLYNEWIKMFPCNKTLVCRCADAAINLSHIEMAENVLATYLTSYPEDWSVWKKAIEIETKQRNVKEVRWMYWEASKSSLFNVYFWKEFLKFELQQCIVTEDIHQVITVLQQCHHLGINLTKLVC